MDRNAEMLALSLGAASTVANAIGYSDVDFFEGVIEALDQPGADGSPLVADASLDVV